MAVYYFISDQYDGFVNLARDAFFLDSVKKGDMILYFFINRRAVIIGRNQNAWKECRLEAMERDGVQLVRRHTGGGAVYHDCGNLNFSFITSEWDYDLDRQMGVIISSLSDFGLSPELSGRNDVLLDGRKISGNAYGVKGNNRSHHGTLLVNAQLDRLGDYLSVSKAKLRAKGVDSVRSRVGNITDFVPDLTPEALRRRILVRFEREYGMAEEYHFTAEETAEIERQRLIQASWEWRFGKTPAFDCELVRRCSFGEMQLLFSLSGGIVKSVRAYSDCLDTSLTSQVESSLVGRRFSARALADALSDLDEKKAETEELREYFLSEGAEFCGE